MIAAADNYKIDSSKYTAPDYGYAGLKYIKAKDNFDRRKTPGNGANPIVKVPKFWRKDMPNGVRMIGTESNETPTVTLTITVPGGHILQTNDTAKIGLASLFSSMMNEDTKITQPSKWQWSCKNWAAMYLLAAISMVSLSISRP